MSPDGSAVLSVDRWAGEVWLCCGLELWRTKDIVETGLDVEISESRLHPGCELRVAFISQASNFELAMPIVEDR